MSTASQRTEPLPLAPPEAHLSTPPQAQTWSWRLVELASAYLPVILMALLAVGTWWLAKNTSAPADRGAAAAPRHEPDYEMREFSVQRYTPTGALQVQITGDVLRHYPDTDTLEIDNVNVRAVDGQGRVSVATAQQAVTDGQATELQLKGGAEVVQEATATEPALRFRSERLHAFLDTKRVTSDKPVQVTQGSTEMSAASMDYTHADGVIRFTGRARAVFDPKRRQP